MTHPLIGTGVALVTPFDTLGNVDFQGLKKLLIHVAHSETRYLVVHGTTGEAATTTTVEKERILSFIQAHNSKNLPIVVGISGNNTAEIIKTIQTTHAQGIDALLVTSPYYNKPSQEGIYRHYAAIATACPIPILLYNIPTRTGINITASTTLRLSEHPNIIGIKETSEDLLQWMEIMHGKEDNFLVISGDDIRTLPMMALGAVGTISVIANGFPKTMARMVELALSNDIATARAYMKKLIPIAKLISQMGNPVGSKQMLAALHICQPHVRLPLTNTHTLYTQDMQKAIFQEANFIV